VQDYIDAVKEEYDYGEEEERDLRKTLVKEMGPVIKKSYNVYLKEYAHLNTKDLKCVSYRFGPPEFGFTKDGKTRHGLHFIGNEDGGLVKFYQDGEELPKQFMFIIRRRTHTIRVIYYLYKRNGCYYGNRLDCEDGWS